MYIFNRMQYDFDRMLSHDMPGQNWNCDLIHDVGNGYPNTGHSISTRCICFSDDGRQDEEMIKRESVLKALEQGEITVDEAIRKLK